MRRSARARLALLLLSVVPTGPPDVPQNAVHIVDEGYLLHIVVWLSPATYADMSELREVRSDSLGNGCYCCL